jgi:hypothetical protein
MDRVRVVVVGFVSVAMLPSAGVAPNAVVDVGAKGVTAEPEPVVDGSAA